MLFVSSGASDSLFNADSNGPFNCGELKKGGIFKLIFESFCDVEKNGARVKRRETRLLNFGG